MEKRNNNLATASLCFALGNIILFIILANVQMDLKLILLICLLVCASAFITGIVGVTQINKDETQKGKGMAITGIVLGALGIFFFGLGYLGMNMLNNPEITKQFCTDEQLVTECVKDDEKTATCLYANTNEIKCYIEDLKESQFK